MGLDNCLKVYQLIEELKKIDQSLNVVVDGYEGGTDPLTREHIVLGYVDLDDSMDYYGEFGDLEDSPEMMGKPQLVIALRR